MPKPLAHLAYQAGQALRAGWYRAEARVAARLAAPVVPRGQRPPGLVTPDSVRLRAALLELLRRDWQNIRDGRYRWPAELVPRPHRLMADTARFFRDLPAVHGRRRSPGAAGPLPAGDHLPAYYRQAFHFQTDGYLSDHSARLYDHQVEVLFSGTADAMRRQVLVPLQAYLRHHPQATARLLDAGAGTGRFLTAVKANYPRLEVIALDLSRPYLAAAGRALAPWRRWHRVQAAAEALPLADASVDLVTCIYLFHELPRPVRAAAAGEFARVLKPGGLLLLMDSLQTGDRPDFDGLLTLFPLAMHEPYFADFAAMSLAPLFADAGLHPAGQELAFLSKLTLWRKPDPVAPAMSYDRHIA